MLRTQNIVTKINILLQEIRDMRLQNKKKNIYLMATRAIPRTLMKGMIRVIHA